MRAHNGRSEHRIKRYAADQDCRRQYEANSNDGDIAVATIWLVFYMLALAAFISSEFFPHAVNFAAR